MSPVTHFLTGWVLASIPPLNRRERGAVTLAAVIPDLDGLGIAAELLTRHSSHPLLWFSLYHHSWHNLLFASIVASLAFMVGTRRWLTAGCAFLAFHLHLIEDLLGSRGPDGFPWPIPYLQPFTARWTWVWDGQWALNAWPNVLLTIVLLLVTLWLAVSRGTSPVGLFSSTADRAVVSALRRRFAMLSSG